MKISGRITAFILSLIMPISFIPVTGASALDTAESDSFGAYGDNITRRICENGLLLISGEGQMHDCKAHDETECEYNAWRKSESSVTEVMISDGVTSIGVNAFSGTDIETVKISDSVTIIGDGAFTACRNLKEVYYIGSREQWDRIAIGSGNESLLNADIYFDIAFCFHKSIKETEAVEPTCTELGFKSGLECADCGEILKKQELVEKKPHTCVVIPEVRPTCTRAGFSQCSKCGVCGKILTAPKVIEKAAHTNEIRITKAAVNKKGRIIIACRVCGNEENEITLYPPKTVVMSKSSYTYTGKPIKPAVSVMDSNSVEILPSNYTVKYENNKKVGTATVTVTFKGDCYSGVLKKTFKIVPNGTTILNVEAKSKGFTLKWDKRKTQTTGYEIQYGTSQNFKKKATKALKIKNAKTVSKKILKLKGEEKYYVRIRTYKKTGGKIYSSSWSKAKNIKTKK